MKSLMPDLPAMHPVHRRFPGTGVSDAEEATHQALARLELNPRIKGKRIALTAGSRGIAQIAVVLRAAVDHVRRCGADPLVVAAMGSHGGGTSEGQRRLLAHLGITQETVGAPISTRMETVVIGHTPDGLAVYCDRVAAGCDGILVINRIKPHTIFFEPFGSGLIKMLGVGLGKVEGATQIHRQGLTALPGAIRAMAQVYLDRGMVVGGLAVVENARDEPAIVEALFPHEMVEREMALFARAREMMPRLPVEEMDVLVVDQVGKNFSGTGMDPNIIGRMRIPGLPEPASPRIGRIVALRLSPESEGNANGIGLADLTTQRLVDAIDREITNLNAITSTFIPESGVKNAQIRS
ncbi:MAG: lactate racemase domain-containing protein [bacterium]|nr:lactate racemase domain-containing protein [bacterium]